MIEPYKDIDIILSISVRKYNIANPQYNFDITVLGNGEIIREGGVYQQDYPKQLPKEILDSILEKASEIDNYTSTAAQQMVHDGPSCSLSIYGYHRPLSFCHSNHEGIKNFINYVDSVVVLAVL